MEKLNKRGISLIVLVITIIVMIIIAGAVVIALDSTGIIEKARQATELMNFENIKTVSEAAWGDAYAAGARTRSEIKAKMEESLRGLDLEKYQVRVTPTGTTVKKVNKNGGVVVEPYKNEYGFYYDLPYVTRQYSLNNTSDGISGMGIAFHEDNTFSLCVSAMATNNKFITIPLQFILGNIAGEQLPIEFEYAEGKIIMYQLDEEGNRLEGQAEFIFDEAGTSMTLGGVAADNTIFGEGGLKCDFTSTQVDDMSGEYLGYMMVDDGEGGQLIRAHMKITETDEIISETINEAVITARINMVEFTLGDGEDAMTYNGITARLAGGFCLMNELINDETGEKCPFVQVGELLITSDCEFIMLPYESNIDGMNMFGLKKVK